MRDPTFVRGMIGLIVFGLVVFALFFYQQYSINTKPQIEPTPTPIAASSGNIIVSLPHAQDTIPQDFRLTGKARVFENVVSIKVYNHITGKIYYSGNTTAYAPDTGQFGDFVADISLKSDRSLRSKDKLLIEVYQASPKDGQAIDVVSIPVVFSPLLP